MAEQQNDTVAAWQQTVTRAVIGTGQIGSRRLHWIWETEDGRRRLGRIIARGLGSAFVVYAIVRLGTYWPWVGVVELIALLWYGHAKARLEETPEFAEDELETELTAEEQVLGIIVGIIGDASGIHLDTLLPILQQEPGCEEMTRDDLRRVLDAVGCPIRRALRVGTRTGIAGVHRDDAQAALDALYEATEPLPRPVAPSEL
ncbi:hypothetical protein EDD99_7147 [Streptomyces sp. 846.5]|nr:hypothetical protein [Streptomyces sp. 846.5]TDT95322.1 hypothetical protein EDD99_7147 [Streptomyces sp. 846.5]